MTTVTRLYDTKLNLLAACPDIDFLTYPMMKLPLSLIPWQCLSSGLAEPMLLSD